MKKYPSQTTRRRYVIGLYGGYLATVGLWALADGLGLPILFVGVVLSLLFFTVSFMQLASHNKYRPWDITTRNDDELDERQLPLRNQVYYYAYQIIAQIAIVSLLYWLAATQWFNWWVPQTGREISATFFAGVLVVTTLPTSVWAWLEPDPIGEDETIRGVSRLKRHEG
jgi:Na+-transporting methylmalonyl-CoA/oxaloacetate decarboxylase gamma subunit